MTQTTSLAMRLLLVKHAKHEVYSNNPFTKDDAACKISPATWLTKDIFVIFEVCQRSKDQNFRHVL